MSKKKQREFLRNDRDRQRAAARRLRADVSELRLTNAELERINGELRVERDAADVLLGEAMDELLGRSKP